MWDNCTAGGGHTIIPDSFRILDTYSEMEMLDHMLIFLRKLSSIIALFL